MDITGDDGNVLKTQHSMKKWDRKKKKFVSTGNVRHVVIYTDLICKQVWL